MMKIPLKNPNLPDFKVCDVALADYSPKLISKLEQYNIKYIITKNNNLLDKRICYHTDMLINNISEGTIIADESQKNNYVNFLTIGYRCKELKTRVKSNYPLDSLLNSVLLGDKLFCNTKTIDKTILEYAYQNSYKILSVNQGYTKCSICPLTQNSLITDDESIYNVCLNNNIDALYVRKGSVILNGFDYGFIGGCTGLIDRDKLLFNGDINFHNDCNKILRFLNKYNIELVIIENEPLTDIGSIIPLTVEVPNDTI